jgi:hypothetical protein
MASTFITNLFLAGGAHRDWRFRVGLFQIIVAITVYFMSYDLSLVPSSQPQLSQSCALEK